MKVASHGLRGIGAGFTRAQALKALGLDVAYEKGVGSALYSDGAEQPVWDFLGGFGAAFFGHNHPALVEAMISFLSRSGVVQGQASVRPASEKLCERMAQRLGSALGGQYHVILASTGAEAVETAAKHADFAYAARRERAAAWARRALPATPASEWTPGARQLLERLGLSGPATLQRIVDHNESVLATEPFHIAVEGSFHGMTTRALKLTHDPGGRFGPRTEPSRVRFVTLSRPDSLAELLAELTRPLLRVRVSGAGWDIESIDWTCAAGFFLEPIQGEGGIHPVPRETAQRWEAECSARDVPLLVDEIQCGMGRTGTFLYSEQLGIAPKYVLLGKSLGGGLAKISAVAVRHEEFLPEFSLQHASTFAEDELSSSVALRALELLEAEDASRIAAETGSRLRQALIALAERHPSIVREVRGVGLMLGLEWRTLDFERSPALRFLQLYGWLGYALSGYLLRAHRVRVAPTLSENRTLRLEPAYSVPEEAVRQLLDGLEELCTLLERQDAAAILGPCLQVAVAAAQRAPPPAIICRPPSAHSHVGFIGHFIDPDGVALWDPGFDRLGSAACRTFLEQIRPFANPLLCHRDSVRSVTGDTTTLSFIGIPVTSQQCHDSLRTSDRRAYRDLVQRALDVAREEGCSVVGLGGYCSILARNGKDLQSQGIALTTGSGYTVGAGLLALEQAAYSHGIEWTKSRAAVIGATGNIGSVLASLLARSVGSLVLLGRPTSAAELRSLAGRILCTIGREAPDSPIAQALHARGIIGLDALSPAEMADVYCRTRRALGDDAPIEIGTDLSMCRDAQLVAAASNHPDSVLFPEHVGDLPTVIIDLALPGDVDRSVLRERPDARVIRGGVIRTPCNPTWSVPGIPLQPGEMFACMTETVLMGLERARSHGSYGSLSTARVLETVAMARKHGFTNIHMRSERN